MKRLGAVLPVVVLACGLAGCGGTDKSADHAAGEVHVPEVEFAPVARVPIRTSLDLVGTLIPVRATTIVSDVDGIIESFPNSNRSLEFEENGQKRSVPLTLDLGHEVREGDVLVQIDPTDFRLALEVAEKKRDLAKKNLDLLKNWMQQEETEQLLRASKEAEAAYKFAKADFDRLDQLHQRHSISRSEYDAAEMALETAKAVRRHAGEALKIAEKRMPAQLAVAQAKFAVAEAEVKVQQEKLDKTTVHAPYDAVIADRYVSVGDRVTAMPRVEIMRIIDPRVLFAEVDVPERYQAKVKLGEMAAVTAEGVSQPVPARVEIVNSMIDPETRTFRVRLTIDNRKRILKSGGFVHVALPIATAVNVTAVPRRAVTFTEGHPAVFVFEPAGTDGLGHVRKAPVELGVANGDSYEITAGVSPGQLVAAEKLSLLTNGLRVQPKHIR